VEAVDLRVHDQLAVDEVAAEVVLLVDPVDADHVAFELVEVDVDVEPEVLDFDAAAVVFVAAVDAVVVDAVPVAMQAPSTAVATTLAAPAVTRDRAAGRRRARCRLVDVGCSLMPTIMRIGGKWRPKWL
jgi:hypothetical protein